MAALHGVPISLHLAASRIWRHLLSVRARGSPGNAISAQHIASPARFVADASAVRLAETVEVDVWRRRAQALRQLQRDSDDTGTEGPIEGLPLLPAWAEEWVMVERLRLQDLLLDTHEAQAPSLMRRGEFALAVATVYEVLRVDPLRERAGQLPS